MSHRFLLTKQSGHQPHTERGFTIIELMIALSVLSIVLVMSAIIMIQLGRMYTKGNNEANTQNIARNVMNDIASQIQLNANTPVVIKTPPTGVVCIGTQRYTYKLDYELNGVPGSPGGTDNSPNHQVLWRDTMKSSGACQPVVGFGLTANPADTLTKPGSGVELLSRKMRLTDFDVKTNNNSYTVMVTVAYGDDDLLQHIAGGTTRCLGSQGGEYCAVSSLTQTVTRRLTN